MKQICKIRFGSHLYGTNTPESDEDYIGVFLPDTRDILLGRIPRTAESSPKDDSRKNLPGEEDSTWFSLHHFLALACQGQTIALDMLYAPDEMIEPGEYFWIWRQLQGERRSFLSRDMKAFVGYARGQAAKYSLKGGRLKKLEGFLAIVKEAAGESGDTPLVAVWDSLPRDDERTNVQGVPEIQIAGKWFGATTRTGLVAIAIQSAIDRYGRRAKSAKEDGGVDWKAMSHAVRVSWELVDLMSKGELIFPLPYADTLLEIKQGKRDLESVQGMLDSSLSAIEDLAAKSDLPTAVDRAKWDDWLFDILLASLRNELATSVQEKK